MHGDDLEPAPFDDRVGVGADRDRQGVLRRADVCTADARLGDRWKAQTQNEDAASGSHRGQAGDEKIAIYVRTATAQDAAAARPGDVQVADAKVS
jgi:hypothetical protein